MAFKMRSPLKRQELSVEARAAKEARDLAYAKTPDRRQKKAENQVLRRSAKKKGREPKMQINTQDNVVIKNASWVWILFSIEFLVEIKKVIPNPRVIIELIINDCHVSLRKARSNIAGTSKTKLKAINKKPNTLSINLKLSM